MRILILADLHSRTEWFEWIRDRRVDLVVIAGDLLDSFRSGGLTPQILQIDDWCRSLSFPLAVSSGNHDANIPGGGVSFHSLSGVTDKCREHVARLAAHGCWMDALERPGVVTDRRTALVSSPTGALVVTTIPYLAYMEDGVAHDEFWKEGKQPRKTHRVPWLVLHHEPPADTSVGGPHGDMGLLWKLREYRPDFVASGHIHHQPYVGSFADEVGGTWCFNPGHPDAMENMEAKEPNHILLDIEKRTATWHAAGKPAAKGICRTIAF